MVVALGLAHIRDPPKYFRCTSECCPVLPGRAIERNQNPHVSASGVAEQSRPNGKTHMRENTLWSFFGNTPHAVARKHQSRQCSAAVEESILRTLNAENSGCSSNPVRVVTGRSPSLLKCLMAGGISWQLRRTSASEMVQCSDFQQCFRKGCSQCEFILVKWKDTHTATFRKWIQWQVWPPGVARHSECLGATSFVFQVVERGFQCLLRWLRPSETRMHHGTQLVVFGVPVAWTAYWPKFTCQLPRMSSDCWKKTSCLSIRRVDTYMVLEGKDCVTCPLPSETCEIQLLWLRRLNDRNHYKYGAHVHIILLTKLLHPRIYIG